MMSMLPSGSIEISNNPQTQVPVKRRISRDEFFQKLREEHDAERRYRLTSIMLPLDGIKRPASVEEWFTSIGRFGNGLDVIPTPTVIIPGKENILSPNDWTKNIEKFAHGLKGTSLRLELDDDVRKLLIDLQQGIETYDEVIEKALVYYKRNLRF
jgi:hypothetical protein